MKKIFAVSIMAVMAVTAANAEIASKAYVDQQDALSATKTFVGSLPSGDAALGATTIVGYIDAKAAAAADAAVSGANLGTMATETASNYYTKTEANAEFVEAPTTAVTTGDYTKVTVDEQGLVTAGTTLSATDIPSGLVAGTAPISATRGQDGVVTVAVADATDSAKGVVQIASASDITTGTATDRVVTVAQLKAVESGASGSYQSKIGGTSGQLVTSSGTSGTVNFVTPQTTAAAASGSTTGAIMTDTAVRATIDGLNLGTMATETASNYKKTADLDSSASATTKQVVTGVTMTDGVITVSSGDPLTTAAYELQEQGVGAGKYALTAIVDNSNNVTGYKWELIERATPAQQGS